MDVQLMQDAGKPKLIVTKETENVRSIQEITLNEKTVKQMNSYEEVLGHLKFEINETKEMVANAMTELKNILLQLEGQNIKMENLLKEDYLKCNDYELIMQRLSTNKTEEEKKTAGYDSSVIKNEGVIRKTYLTEMKLQKAKTMKRFKEYRNNIEKIKEKLISQFIYIHNNQ